MDSMAGGCNAPLLPAANYPDLRGDIQNRFCANLTISGQTTECCLPCPATDWIYSDAFRPKSHLANYVSIASLVLNGWLLLTFLVLPEEKSHRHYMSVGLTVSLLLIALAFVIPLGGEPDFCYNDITPNDLHTDVMCGFTGALVEAGAMGVVVWILLRSIWTSLRIMTKFRHHTAFRITSIILGIGLPALFLAISLPISDVSYRLGNVCIPNRFSALATWFAWILIFAAIGFAFQVVTIVFCLWRFANSMFGGPAAGGFTGGGGAAGTGGTKASVNTTDSGKTRGSSLTPAKQRRQDWRKVRKVLVLQWRSIVLAFVVANLTIYFGIVFVQQNLTTKPEQGTENLTSVDLTYFVCLMANKGDKTQCRSASGLGLSEGRAVGTLVLASFVGIGVFLLMVRWSMLVGWYHLLLHPRSLLRRNSTASDEEDFVMLSPRTAASKRMQAIDSGVRRRSSGQIDEVGGGFGGDGGPGGGGDGGDGGGGNGGNGDVWRHGLRSPTKSNYAEAPREWEVDDDGEGEGEGMLGSTRGREEGREVERMV